MRKEIIDYAKTITKNTLLTEVAKVVKTYYKNGNGKR